MNNPKTRAKNWFTNFTDPFTQSTPTVLNHYLLVQPQCVCAQPLLQPCHLFTILCISLCIEGPDISFHELHHSDMPHHFVYVFFMHETTSIIKIKFNRRPSSTTYTSSTTPRTVLLRKNCWIHGSRLFLPFVKMAPLCQP